MFQPHPKHSRFSDITPASRSFLPHHPGPRSLDEQDKEWQLPSEPPLLPREGRREDFHAEEKFVFEEAPEAISVPETAFSSFSSRPQAGKTGVALFWIAVSMFIVIGGVFSLGKKGGELKMRVMAQGESGYGDLTLALESLKKEDYAGSLRHFTAAEKSFAEAKNDITFWGETLSDLTRFVPGLSKVASGKYALSAGEHFARAGVPLSLMAKEAAESKSAYTQGEKTSLLELLRRLDTPLAEAGRELEKAQTDLEKIDIAHLPEDKRERFLQVKQNVPVLIGLMKSFERNEKLWEELLGGNGPRKYLFLLQNNHELRPTGGFIGSYALLDVNEGVVRRFFVDGIFNPDGQLRENIIPPKPIQKVSAAWSLHDSNWFPDFPTSAEKAIFFYEKTGGPTVDGVITLTPTVMQKLLAVTGPIELPQYGLTVDAENFMPVIQEQVEVKYDKEENQPKKILGDLCFALIEKVFASQERSALYQVAEGLVSGLNEKQMLLYMRHPQTQALIDEAGWSGRMLPASKDYLSVVHTNINGYKTDGVIEETIKHRAEIQSDGSIIDTVTINRAHRGGNTPYDWWNRVNADYLRVYVPEGSELLSAKGTTWEFPEAPLDYARLGFKSDSDIVREEEGIRLDEKSGTRISEESGKTVFGAWVYVSPQESVTVEYRYRLPFRLDLSELRKGKVDSYTALYQKQSGTLGSRLEAEVAYPEGFQPIWQTGGNLVPYERILSLHDTLLTDKFLGAVFSLN